MSTVPLNFSWRVWTDKLGCQQTLGVKGIPMPFLRVDEISIRVRQQGSVTYRCECSLPSIPTSDPQSFRIPFLDSNDWKLLLPNLRTPYIYLMPIRTAAGGFRVLLNCDKQSSWSWSCHTCILMLWLWPVPQSENVEVSTPILAHEFLEHLIFDDPSLIDVVIP